MRPGMATDRHAGGNHLLGDLRAPSGVLADLEEGRLQAFVGKLLEHGGRVARPRAVVEGQDDFLVAQEVVLLEMLEAEAGTAGRIDLDNAGLTPPGWSRAGMAAAAGAGFACAAAFGAERFTTAGAVSCASAPQQQLARFQRPIGRSGFVLRRSQRPLGPGPPNRRQYNTDDEAHHNPLPFGDRAQSIERLDELSSLIEVAICPQP
jgi:hypothetical protein